MRLKETKAILDRYVKKNSKYLENAKTDIKPDYSEKGFGMKSGEGYSYAGFEPNDRDFIYNSIRELELIVNDRESAIQFDIENVFITETKAVSELKNVKKFVSERLESLKKLEEKYHNIEHSHYPLNVCINSYQNINDILNEIFTSIEYRDFNQPDLVNTLEKKIDTLEFANYWRKRKFRYIIHLVLFIPFFAGLILVLIYKEKDIFNGFSKSLIIVLSGVATILFNLFFNNHSSFKDSFKLLTKKSREKLIEKEKKNFHN